MAAVDLALWDILAVVGVLGVGGVGGITETGVAAAANERSGSGQRWDGAGRVGWAGAGAGVEGEGGANSIEEEHIGDIGGAAAVDSALGDILAGPIVASGQGVLSGAEAGNTRATREGLVG